MGGAIQTCLRSLLPAVLGQGLCVRRWYYCLCVPPFEHKVSEKVVARNEETAGALINFNKSEGLRLGAWRSGVLLPGTFHLSDEPICILKVWYGLGLQLERNWWKYMYMTSKAFILKEMVGGVRCVHLLLNPLQAVYSHSLRVHGWHWNNPSPNCFGKVECW